MPWQKALSDEDEKRLVVDHEDGFKVVQLVERYKVSRSTVERILADAGARMEHRPRKKRKQLRAAAKGRALKPCGTNAAYARHIRAKESPCLPCVDAHAAEIKSQYDPVKAKAKREARKIRDREDLS